MKDNLNSLDKFLHVSSHILYIIYLFAASMICGILFYLAILPLKYFSIVIIISILLAAILGFFVIRKNKKRIIRIIVFIFELIFTGGYVFAFFFVNSNLNLLGALQAGGYKIEEYSLITLKSSNYTDINSIKGTTIAIYNERSESYQSALDEMNKAVTATTAQYTDAVEAAGALLDGRANVLFIKNAMKEIVNEILPDFKEDNLQTIHTFSIRTIAPKTASKDSDVSEKPFNLLISGIDTRGEVSTVSRSDVNMIVTINPKTYEILLTSIPRDYYVQLHNTVGIRDKLTHSGLYGIDMTLTTIEDLFNIDIDYYIRLNFDSTEKIIDTVGGIDLTPDTTFKTSNGHGSICYFTANETIHVDGACGLAYARTRKVYSDGDFHRILNQQEVLIGIIDQLAANKSITAYANFLSAAEGSIETNIPTGQIYKLINLQLDKNPHWHIDRISVGGTSTKDYTYTINVEILYVVEPDMNSVHAATDRINAVLSATPSDK